MYICKTDHSAMEKKITFKEVAKLAGVSTQTVSRVTNGGLNVDPITLKRVQEAINTLGYIPNKGAQLLVRKSAKIFGVLSLGSTFEGAASIVEGIRLESLAIGYHISIAVTEEGEEQIELAIKELQSQQVEAIFINLPLTTAIAEKIVNKHSKISFLFIDVPYETAVNQVSSDHYQGAKLVADLVLNQGRKQIALLNGPSISYAANCRTKAWMDAITNSEASIVAQAEGNWSAESGYLETTKLLSQAIEFDALLVGNDQMALGALRACAEFKKEIPLQIAVTGFDDTTNSAYFNPPLTTVRQNFLELGRKAVQKIANQIKNGDHSISKNKIPVTLIERKSTQTTAKDPKATEKIANLLQEINKLLPHLS